MNHEEFDGIQFPWVPSTRYTIADGSEVDVAPNYVNHMRKFLENGNLHTWEFAVTSMLREALLFLRRENVINVGGFEAPISTSNEVAPDTMVITNERIILNEDWALARFIDADGDRATVFEGVLESEKVAVLVKFPITMPPAILKVIRTAPKEQFGNFSKATAKKRLIEHKEDNPISSIDEIFIKKHQSSRVGILTNAHNVRDLFETRKLEINERLEALYNTHINEAYGIPQRAVDIELGEMKASRKDSASHLEASVTDFPVTLDDNSKWFLTGASAIGKMSTEMMEWVLDVNLDEHITKLLNLEVGFKEKFVPKKKEPTIPKIIDGGLIARLKQLNLINWIELPSVNPSLPPAVIFWLQTPSGHPCALVDVKRGDQPEGLTYFFVLYPTWDNSQIEGVKSKPRFVHPIEHMAKTMSAFDSTIRPYAGGEIKGYFPRSHRDWNDPKWAIKVSMLQKELTKYVSQWGDVCPAIKTRSGIAPTNFAKSVATRTVVIDYGKEMEPEEMLKIFKEAAKIAPLNPGNKSTDMRIRKYMIGYESNSYATIAPESGVHPTRPGQNRSQLLRALNQATYNVAIVQMNTRSGCLITPSGIEKQKVETSFLPQVFNTKEEYQNHLIGHGLTEEQLPCQEEKFFTWRGEQRVCWTIAEKSTILIGKLVDALGNKFMPRRYSQATAIKIKTNVNDPNATREIDVIIPYNELLDKGCLEAFMEGAEEVNIIVDGEVFRGLFVQRKLFRTGAASENVPPRHRTAHYGGLDGLKIIHEIRKVRDIPHLQPKTEFASQLLAAMVAFAEKNRLSLIPESEEEYYED